MTTKTYTAAGLTVVWKPGLCIHSAKCVGALPQVFDPNRRPWIDVSAAEAAEVQKAVRMCPSGALSLGDQPAVAAETAATVTIELAANGPLIVRGGHELKGAGGAGEAKSGTVAYCRCGASARKPYCDGSHAKAGFKG